jgi:[ribosomal protein S5]-alanine N-acetyltransferase
VTVGQGCTTIDSEVMNTCTAFDKFPYLETDRLILREIQLTDAEAIFRILADPDVTKYQDIATATSIEQAKRLIALRAERLRADQGIRWAIATKIANRLIGSCGFSYKTPFQAEIGYELAKANWGRGLMTEALSAMIDFGFQQAELNRLEAMVMLENKASMRVLEKLGFIEEGILRQYGFWQGQFHDLKLFSLLKGDRTPHS